MCELGSLNYLRRYFQHFELENKCFSFFFFLRGSNLFKSLLSSKKKGGTDRKDPINIRFRLISSRCTELESVRLTGQIRKGC